VTGSGTLAPRSSWTDPYSGIVVHPGSRSTHASPVQAAIFRLPPIVRVPATRAARETSKGVMPRIPKDAHIEDKPVKLRDGTTKLCRVHAIDGELCLVEFNLYGRPTPFTSNAVASRR
jgi:hypothetical protein